MEFLKRSKCGQLIISAALSSNLLGEESNIPIEVCGGAHPECQVSREGFQFTAPTAQSQP